MTLFVMQLEILRLISWEMRKIFTIKSWLNIIVRGRDASGYRFRILYLSDRVVVSSEVDVRGAVRVLCSRESIAPQTFEW